MRIKNVKEDSKGDDVFIVTFEPNLIEKLFGVKEDEVKYKDTGRIFIFGGGHVYINQKGEYAKNISGIGDEIDKYRRRWE